MADIWDLIDREIASDSEYSWESEEETKIVEKYDIIKILSNSPLFKKYEPRPPPTVEQALKDLFRILNSQKFRVWRLRQREATDEPSVWNDSA